MLCALKQNVKQFQDEKYINILFLFSLQVRSQNLAKCFHWVLWSVSLLNYCF